MTLLSNEVSSMKWYHIIDEALPRQGIQNDEPVSCKLGRKRHKNWIFGAFSKTIIYI